MAKIIKKEECYYSEYSVCTCNHSKNCDKRCVGAEACEQFISQNEYFNRMMAGEIMEKSAPEEDSKVRQARLNAKLAPEKTKKQLKYEARKEAEQYGDGTGYALKDDPRFKDLFNNFK